MKPLNLLLLLFISTVCHALPDASPVPGGIAVINLGQYDTEPEVRFYRKRVTVIKDGEGYTALVGIPLSAKTGQHTLQVVEPEQTIPFQVLGKDYPEQRLTIKNKRKVNPNPDDVKRINSERTRKANAKNAWSDVTPELNMSLPVQGRYSSAFGLRRFFNEQPRNPHAGLDIAAARGTPILAPAPGRVIEAGDFFFSGNCVWLDHGKGIVSLYAHMNEINVNVGDQVDRGELIGTVGDTGRVTGPHLHWSIGLNGTWIDPSLFLPIELRPQTD